jgi:hypothetical protein
MHLLARPPSTSTSTGVEALTTMPCDTRSPSRRIRALDGRCQALGKWGVLAQRPSTRWTSPLLDRGAARLVFRDKGAGGLPQDASSGEPISRQSSSPGRMPPPSTSERWPPEHGAVLGSAGGPCPTRPLPRAVTGRLWSHLLRLLTRRVQRSTVDV